MPLKVIFQKNIPFERVTLILYANMKFAVMMFLNIFYPGMVGILLDFDFHDDNCIDIIHRLYLICLIFIVIKYKVGICKVRGGDLNIMVMSRLDSFWFSTLEDDEFSNEFYSARVTFMETGNPT